MCLQVIPWLVGGEIGLAALMLLMGGMPFYLSLYALLFGMLYPAGLLRSPFSPGFWAEWTKVSTPPLLLCTSCLLVPGFRSPCSLLSLLNNKTPLCAPANRPWENSSARSLGSNIEQEDARFFFFTNTFERLRILDEYGKTAASNVR